MLSVPWLRSVVPTRGSLRFLLVAAAELGEGSRSHQGLLEGTSV